jgi:hypothetical protein
MLTLSRNESAFSLLISFLFFSTSLFISMILVIEQSHKPVLNYLFPLISNNEQHGK